MNTLEARRRLLGRNVYKRTTEGNPAIAQGSLARMYPGITMQGWTEQAQYEGNQLFDESDIQVVSTDSEGTQRNGEEISGLPEGQYTISSRKKTIGTICYLYAVVKTASGEFGSNIYIVTNTNILTPTVTINNGDSIIIYDAQPHTLELSKSLFEEYGIMLNEGSTALPYEPYTGGQPSPSPDYPQEIVSAGKYNEDTQKWEYEIEVGCGQLLNFQENNVTSSGITCESKIDTITINGTKTNGDGGRLIYKTNDFVLQPGTYTFSHEVVNDINSTISGIFLTKKDSNGILGRTFTLNESTEVYIGTNIYEARQANDVVVRCMLNTGSTPLPYTPYRTPQTVTLTADRPLTKWDKLEKRNGQWGWVYKSMEITLDESEEWRVYAAYEGFYIGYVFDTPRLRAEGFCESFICQTELYDDRKDAALWIGMNNYSVYAIRIPQYNEELPDSGLQDWKDWLSENPITILTYADEETFVPLSPEEQEQMNALHTFRPTTVLSNDEGCEMSLTYKTKKSLEVTT